MMQNVLVTGAAGFLGSHLCDRLISAGYFVYGIDNLSTGNLNNLIHLKDKKNFKFTESDISVGITPDLSLSFDYIYHLASPASPPKYLALPIETIHVNTVGTENLLNHVKSFGGKLLFASTSEIYGDPIEHPQTEDYWGNVNPIGPRSVYDEAKRLGESLVSLYQRENWADAAIIRIFNTYGPRMDPFDGRVVSSFLRDGILGKSLTIFGDGTQTRSFCYVDDLISGIISTMESNLLGPVNLGSQYEFTLLELANKVCEVLGIQPSIKFEALPQDDPKQRKPDISFAKKLLDWEPKIQLEEGLTKTSEWMREILN